MCECVITSPSVCVSCVLNGGRAFTNNQDKTIYRLLFITWHELVVFKTKVLNDMFEFIRESIFSWVCSTVQ